MYMYSTYTNVFILSHPSASSVRGVYLSFDGHDHDTTRQANVSR